MDHRTRLLQAIVNRLKTVQPDTVFYDFELGNCAGTYSTDVVDTFDYLQTLLMHMIEDGCDPDITEHDLGLLAIFYLALHDIQTIPENCDRLTEEQDAIVKQLLS